MPAKDAPEQAMSMNIRVWTDTVKVLDAIAEHEQRARITVIDRIVRAHVAGRDDLPHLQRLLEADE